MPHSKATLPFLAVSELALKIFSQCRHKPCSRCSWTPRVTSVGLYYNIKLMIENCPRSLQELGLIYLRAAGSAHGTWCTMNGRCVSLENKAINLLKAMLLSMWSRHKSMSITRKLRGTDSQAPPRPTESIWVLTSSSGMCVHAEIWEVPS